MLRWAYSLLLVVLMALPASAGFDDGLAAVQRGDCATALREFLAEQGDARAQYNLGVMYNNGYGVPQDYVQAAKLFRKAAAQGHVGAQHNLGIMYGKPRKPAAFEPDRPVAQNENAWATVGNQEREVAQVAQRQEEWATEDGSPKTAANCDYLEPVAQVAQVAQKNDTTGIAEWDADEWRAFLHLTQRRTYNPNRAEAKAFPGSCS